MVKHSNLETIEGITFLTDRMGVIQSVGKQNWNAFALENGAPELTADAVIGRNFFDFIQGDQIRDQFRLIMERMAEDPNWAWVLPFRCDSPDQQRNIRQVVKPVFSGNTCTGFLFQSVEKFARHRPPMGLFDFKKLAQLAKKEANLPLVTMCSWCQKVKTMQGDCERWISADDYYAAGGRSAVRISHAICDACFEVTALLSEQ